MNDKDVSNLIILYEKIIKEELVGTLLKNKSYLDIGHSPAGIGKTKKYFLWIASPPYYEIEVKETEEETDHSLAFKIIPRNSFAGRYDPETKEVSISPILFYNDEDSESSLPYVKNNLRDKFGEDIQIVFFGHKKTIKLS